MPYGLETQELAEDKARGLRVAEPKNKFDVAPNAWWGLVPRTWGVVRYIPYRESMPWRCEGFVWFGEPQKEREWLYA